MEKDKESFLRNLLENFDPSKSEESIHDGISKGIIIGCKFQRKYFEEQLKQMQNNPNIPSNSDIISMQHMGQIIEGRRKMYAEAGYYLG